MFRSILRFPSKISTGVSVFKHFASTTTTTTTTTINTVFARPSILASTSTTFNLSSPSLVSFFPYNRPTSTPVEFQPLSIEPKEYDLDTVDKDDDNNTMHALSVLRKRRLKMKKHKYKKRRKAQRALRKRLGK
ncbi:hypothetical protein MG5_04325 [Candida albicans P57072]|nr:hypothetical protein MG5_04325 [Candida albicans P57072]KHC32890.1 hypothetical protein MGO_04291 [Candida albicans P76055]